MVMTGKTRREDDGQEWRSVSIPRELWKNPEIGPTEKFVLLTLRSLARKSTVCYPKMSVLERETGMPVRTISRALKRLESIGLIRISRGNYAHDKRQQEYHLLFLGESPEKSANMAGNSKESANMSAIYRPDCPQSSANMSAIYRPDCPQSPALIIITKYSTLSNNLSSYFLSHEEGKKHLDLLDSFFDGLKGRHPNSSEEYLGKWVGALAGWLAEMSPVVGAKKHAPHTENDLLRLEKTFFGAELDVFTHELYLCVNGGHRMPKAVITNTQVEKKRDESNSQKPRKALRFKAPGHRRDESHNGNG